MVSYSFSCFGHKNILGTHRNTIEFTKDKNLSLDGDCIIGVRADFELDDLKEFIRKNKKIKIIIKVDDLTEEITVELNPDFNHKREIVIRKSDFVSDRTLGIKADKAAVDLSRKMVEKMKNSETKMKIQFLSF